MKSYTLLLSAMMLSLLSCQDKSLERQLDIQGHRGCRGLMPENTIPAFLKAMEIGVNTLELDLAVTADKEVIVSHEPYFRADISMKPDGNPVTDEEQHQLNMYQMPYDSIRQYDVGSLPDPKHPNRINLKTYRPRLVDVIQSVKEYCDKQKKEMPYWNIEIKRDPKYDNMYHPNAQSFVGLVMPILKETGIWDRTTIQSFDLESLQVAHASYPILSYALLIENEKSIETNIEELGFKPDIYSCYYKLVDDHVISYAKENGIKVIPWTINDETDITAMIDIGVDGIISDYPDRVKNIWSAYANR